MFTTILAVIFVLGVLIFFHELGHFAVARWFRMGVSTFSLGFGPKLVTWKRGKTEYALSLIPLGGYVALVGETDDVIPEGFTEEECFSKRPAWQRFLVVAAGPLANFLLAILLCWSMAFVWGSPIALPEVGAVKDGSPAALAGVRPGDRVCSVDGVELATWDDLSAAISASQGRPMQVVLERREGGAPDRILLTLTAEKATRTTIFGEKVSAWLVGIVASGALERREENFFSAAVAGVRRSWQLTALTWEGLVKLVQRVVPADQVGGPIMIAQLVGEQVRHGLLNLLGLTALISINLGILNLLPIPVLDGGTLVFCSIEMLVGRPVNQKVQEYALRFGIAVLVALMLFATYNDIMRILRS